MEGRATSGDRVQRVVILGGDTAGWMRAAALAKTFGQRLSVTLLESEVVSNVTH
ncbi:tryptophan 7-halogenase [Sphingomonas aerophila]|uniref:tryptophan 7-halogenase n=1 Tax=Sphingomonas aerophila TaxID=1344948 RepID=UPI00160C3066|nr:tryptophan 7-halogenase [Sphingomonas aerophila]